MYYNNDGKINNKFNKDELIDLEQGKNRKRDLTGKIMMPNGY
jgi:hypothetical protein